MFVTCVLEVIIAYGFKMFNGMMNRDFYQLGMLLIMSLNGEKQNGHLGCLVCDRNDPSLEPFEL